MAKTEKKERLKKKEVKAVRARLIDLLQKNARNMREYKRILKDSPHARDRKKCASKELKSVEDIITELYKCQSPKKLGRKTLSNWLEELRTQGSVRKERVGKSMIYFYREYSNPRFFWEEILDPKLHSMKIDDGRPEAWPFTFAKAEDGKSLFCITARAAILGAGTRFLTRFSWKPRTDPFPEKEPVKDLLDFFVEKVDLKLKNQFKRVYKSSNGVSIDGDVMKVSNEKLEQIKKRLKGTKLAFICVLDGSDFSTIDVPAK